jgi:uncharacterized phiE125 gp8 family phage protein
MSIGLKLVTPPTVEPVTLALAKSHLCVDFPEDDALISAYITAARQYCEKYTHRVIFNQTWQLSLDHFPMYGCDTGSMQPSTARNWPYWGALWDGLMIRLPRPTCVSVTSIIFTDQSGTTQTLDPSSYTVDINSEPARIVPAPTTFWPYTQSYLPGSVKITYVAGSYGDGATVNTCPQTVVIAILLMVGHLYEHRHTVSELSLKEIPLGVKALLDTVRFDTFTYETGY